MNNFEFINLIIVCLLGTCSNDDPIDLALKPIKPIFDELGLKEHFPQLEESIKSKILKEKNQTQSLQHYMEYFYNKVNSVYEMVKNPVNITPSIKKLTEKIVDQVGPWFDKNNFDDETLTIIFKLNEDEIDDYHEMYASSKILLRMIKRMLTKYNTNLV